MKLFRKPVSLLLAVIMVLSVFTIIPITTASALADGDTVTGSVNKWVKGTDQNNGLFRFEGLYSNVIFVRADPDNFDYSFDNIWNRTGNLTYWGNNTCYVYAYGENYLQISWVNDSDHTDAVYLVDQVSNISTGWYAYTWTDSVAITYRAAVSPTYDATAQDPYVHGTEEYYTYGGLKFKSNGENEYSQTTDDALVVPYFEFRQHGTAEAPMIKLEKCNSTDANIIVPETVPANYPNAVLPGEGFGIIAENAFADLTNLQTVTIGDNVNHLGGANSGEGAFYRCTSLTSVTVGDSLDFVAQNCFQGCSSLTDFTTTSSSGDPYSLNFTGVSNIAMYNGGLTVHCYRGSDIAEELGDNEFVTISYIECDTHNYTASWDWSGFDQGVVTLELECAVCRVSSGQLPATLTCVADPGSAATCTQAGSGHYVASAEYQGQTYTDTDNNGHACVIPAAGHTPATTGIFANRYIANSGTTALRQQYVCSKCSVVYNDASDFAVTHHEAASADCTTAGNYDYCEDEAHNYYKLSNENSVYNKVSGSSNVIIPATGHTWSTDQSDWEWVWSPDVEADPGRNNITVHMDVPCVDCDEVLEVNAPMIDVESTSAPTCSTPGTVVYAAVVSHSGYNYTDTRAYTTLPPTGDHQYGEWALILDSNTGVISGSRSCTECGTPQTYSDINTDHVTAKAATCTEVGNIEYYYSPYFEVYMNAQGQTVTQAQTVISATGHDYSGAPSSWSWASDHSTATATFTCAHNPAHTQTVNASVSSADTTPATLSTDGLRTFTATVTGPDNNVYTDEQTEVIPATAVAKITGGDYWFDSFSAAVSRSVTSYAGQAVITLLKDIGETYSFPAEYSNYPIKVEKNGHELTVVPPVGYTFTETTENGVTTYTIHDYRVAVTYLDESGDEQTAYAFPISSALTDDAESAGWFYADGEAAIDGSVTLSGDIKVILKNDSELTVSGDFGTTDNNGSSLTFYQQAYVAGAAAGALSADSIEAGSITVIGGDLTATDGISSRGFSMSSGKLNTKSVYVSGDILISGGEFNVDRRENGVLDSSTFNAVSATGNVTVTGGDLMIYGNTAILATSGTITISGGDTILRGYGSGMLGRNIVINGGQVYAVASDDAGIRCYDSITLSWTNEDDRIYSNGYDADVTLLKPFKDQNNWLYRAGTVNRTALASKTLTPAEEELIMHSLSLDGDIGVNFYVKLPSGCSAANTAMDFSWGNKFISYNTYSEDEPYTCSDVTGQTDGSYVKYTVRIAPKELNDTITAVLKRTDNGSTILIDTYSGAEYAYDLLGRDSLENYTETQFSKLQTLARSMLIYAAKAQIEFEYNYDVLATYGLDDDTLSPVNTAALGSNVMTALPDYLTYYGASLNLGSETSYMVIFQNDDERDLSVSAKYSGTNTALAVTHQRVANASGCEVLNIPAARVFDDIDLTIDGSSVTVNVGAYVKDVLDRNIDADLSAAVTALYSYSTAAYEFFTSIGRI